jgi:CRISPR type III-B/RAMP module-associated protein Cmr5
MQRSESLDLAIRCIEALKRVFGDKERILDGFKTRARHVPSSIYYSGLTYTIAYVASKASKDKYSGVNLMTQALTKSDLGALFESWKNENTVKEEAYELYGACLMRAIREVAKMDGINDLLTLLKVLNDPGRQILVTNKVLEFAEWLKRLAEASISG